MASPKVQTPELRFLINIEDRKSRSDAVVFTARIVYVDDKDGGRIKNPLGDSCLSDAWQEGVADLQVRAQADPRADASECLQDWYGWDVSYGDVYNVSLRRAKAMVKTLSNVERKLEKLEARFGRPRDLLSYLGRVGDALGVGTYGWAVTRGNFYADGEYRWGSLDNARDYTADALAKAQGVSA